MTTLKVVVIDYGIGNVYSVLRALDRLGVQADLTSDRSRIMAADRVILPGVGAFGRAADTLRKMNLQGVIHDYIATGKPFLGICVGMQLLMETGEEFGTHQGLGIIPGTVRKITARDEVGQPCRIPLIGWLPVEESMPGIWAETPFQRNLRTNAFYFVHSFQAEVVDPSHCIAFHQLGDSRITAAVRRDNVLGVQFHPERSGAVGQDFLAAFLSM